MKFADYEIVYLPKAQWEGSFRQNCNYDYN